VRRDHTEETLHRNYLLVGDVIQIKTGMNIPVDGLVIVGIGVLADESAMTGESDHLHKESMTKCLEKKAEFERDAGPDKEKYTPHDVPSPVLLSGTQINTGEGWFLCIVVGDSTCEGQIMAAVNENKSSEVTPLQAKLEVIATDIGKLGMYAAILIFHVLLFRDLLEGMVFRSFDLMGGTSEWYAPIVNDPTKNPLTDADMAFPKCRNTTQGTLDFTAIKE